MIKVIWIFIGLNILFLLVFVGAYFVINNGKQVSYEEKGWTIVLSTIGLIFILLAAVPLRFIQSAGTQIFSGIFAFMPIVLAVAFSMI